MKKYCTFALGLSALLLAGQLSAATIINQGSLISTLGGSNAATNTFRVAPVANTNLPYAQAPAFSVSGIGSQGLTLIVDIVASNAGGNTNNGTIDLMLAPAVNGALFATGGSVITVNVPHNGTSRYIWATNIAQSAFGAVESVRLYNCLTTNIGSFNISNVLARAVLTSL